MRLIGYVRVSRVGGREGESFISPEVQRERIAAYATAHGHRLVEVVTDLDASGGTMRRPRFEEALQMIEAGKADGMIVAKLDRFARTVRGALECIERLNEAGAVLVSVADNIDASTPSGELMLNVLLSLAQWQRSMLREEWRSSRAKAIERGVHIATHVPIGYRRGADGRLEVDPDTAPIVVAAFEARAAGDGLTKIGRMLDTGRQGAAYIIRNRAYLGEAHSGSGAGRIVNEDAHPAIVPRDLWEKAQRARIVASPRGEGLLLAGLARCAHCRHTLSGTRGKYRCTNDRCTSRAAIMSERLDGNVRTLYAMFIEIPAQVEAEAAGELLDARTAAEAELSAFVRVMRATEPGFREGLDARQAVVEECRRALAAAATPELVALDPDEPIAEQRRKLSKAIVAIFVRKGAGPIETRCRIVWSGSTVELPKRGNGTGPMAPFKF